MRRGDASRTCCRPSCPRSGRSSWSSGLCSVLTTLRTPPPLRGWPRRWRTSFARGGGPRVPWRRSRQRKRRGRSWPRPRLCGRRPSSCRPGWRRWTCSCTRTARCGPTCRPRWRPCSAPSTCAAGASSRSFWTRPASRATSSPLSRPRWRSRTGQGSCSAWRVCTSGPCGPCRRRTGARPGWRWVGSDCGPPDCCAARGTSSASSCGDSGTSSARRRRTSRGPWTTRWRGSPRRPRSTMRRSRGCRRRPLLWSRSSRNCTARSCG
mmetsp:Transcript_29959/g.42746  ORF Transcript_29959/g.42746 Transcript_29959/m.42746 type:complete len:265 (-) Transcript_29959:1169-1963(-)